MRVLSAIAVLATLAACSVEPNPNDANVETVTFEFVHETHNERFKARTSDADVIARARAELAKPLKDRILHPIGDLQRGDGGVNSPWSWSFEEDDWSLTEFSVEVCDAWPGYVEDNLDEWLSNPGFFCPWASRVEKELN